MLYESTREAGDPTLPDVSTLEAYVGHFMAYAALAFCAQMAPQRRSLVIIPFVIAAAGIFGGLLEAYQSTLYGRDASILDALTNLLGAAIGIAIAAFLVPRWEHWRVRGNRQR